MVMIISPKYAVSEVVGKMKGKTPSLLRKKFSSLAEVYWKENIVWSPGYFVSTVGNGGKRNPQVCEVAAKSGFRSSEA